MHLLDHELGSGRPEEVLPDVGLDRAAKAIQAGDFGKILKQKVGGSNPRS